MNGKAHPVTTAAARYLTMTATIVNIATGIIAAVAAAIARGAIRRFVWGVPMSVPHVMSWSAITAPQNARNVMERSARIA
jgi:phage-related protein